MKKFTVRRERRELNISVAVNTIRKAFTLLFLIPNEVKIRPSVYILNISFNGKSDKDVITWNKIQIFHYLKRQNSDTNVEIVENILKLQKAE